MPLERRQHKRIQIESQGHAVLFGPTFTKGVQIIDICKGGLAFRYAHDQKPSNGLFELDILWDHNNFKLIKLKVETISDYQIPNEFLLGVIPLRRCGVQFVELTKDQISQLENFIEKDSTGEA
jgi:hypothetical protein